MPAYALEVQILMGCGRGELAPLRRVDVKPDGIMIWREQVSVKRYGDVACGGLQELLRGSGYPCGAHGAESKEILLIKS